jgi:hypothetical protein
MINKQGKLEAFENFRIDYSLPKHQREETSSDSAQKSSSMFSEGGGIVVSGTWNGADSSTIFVNTQNIPRPLNAFAKSWRRVASYFTKETEKPAKGAISVEQFFRSIKNSAEELKTVDARAKGYVEQMKKAKEAGQTALFEQLTQGLAAARAEAQLLAIDLPRYVTEEKVVEFAKLCKRGLRLDWIANFTRVIPDEVLAPKKTADEHKVFDNYLILHYDPAAKAYSETEAEVARRKDPILFGVIAGRRRLYFVGDWVDEYCTLTLDEIADVVGQDAVSKLYDEAN